MDWQTLTPYAVVLITAAATCDKTVFGFMRNTVVIGAGAIWLGFIQPPSVQELPSVQPTEKHQTPTDLKSKASYWASQYKIDARLFKALINQESLWRVRAESYVGARGLGQVMPFNAAYCGIKPDELWDADKNLACAAKILKSELIHFDNQFPNDKGEAIRHALAAYNAGRGRAARALQTFPETKNYVRKITANYGG